MAPKPGEVYLCITADGSKRPGVVLSREQLNRGDFVVIVPVTSARFEERRHLKNCVPFFSGHFGLTKDCVAQAEQVSAVRKANLDLAAGPLGRLDAENLRALIRAVGHVIDAECEPL
jgi:mRNA-degrading endonuclease toxin of MazEF toxin-antitoxin module